MTEHQWCFISVASIVIICTSVRRLESSGHRRLPSSSFLLRHLLDYPFFFGLFLGPTLIPEEVFTMNVLQCKAAPVTLVLFVLVCLCFIYVYVLLFVLKFFFAVMQGHTLWLCMHVKILYSYCTSVQNITTTPKNKKKWSVNFFF